jgi:uncharacterized integral membrane protein (TIGR00697 family)
LKEPIIADPKLIHKSNNLFLALTGFFLTNALLAEVIGTKIFSLEDWLGVAPAQISLLGFGPYSFNLTCGVLLWPFVFITTDVINEYFGKKGVQRVSWMAAGLIVYMFLMTWVVTKTPPAAFWLDLNAKDANGHPFDINYAFGSIFRQGMGIMVGSVTAFLLGQIVDAGVFHSIRKRTGEKHIWLRATGSTLVSQFIDSFVVLYIAFGLFGNWPFAQVVAVGVVNYIYKTVAAVALTPLLYVAHGVIDRYLGKKGAVEVEV